MKRTRTKKGLLLVLLLVLVLAVSVGGTIAWITTNTGEIENVFTPTTVNTKIEEGFDETTKSSVVIKNTSEDVDVYVRVSVVGNWVKKDQKKVQVVAPWEGAIDLNTAGGWFADGEFYYYRYKLSADGGQTANLLAKPYTYSSDDVPVEGATLDMTIISQAIQADPKDAVTNAWGAAVAAKLN